MSGVDDSDDRVIAQIMMMRCFLTHPTSDAVGSDAIGCM